MAGAGPAATAGRRLPGRRGPIPDAALRPVAPVLGPAIVAIVVAPAEQPIVGPAEQPEEPPPVVPSESSSSSSSSDSETSDTDEVPFSCAFVVESSRLRYKFRSNW